MTEISQDPRDQLIDRSIAPVVPLPNSGLSNAAIAAICAVVGLILFLVLDNNRRHLRNDTASVTTVQPLQSPPPLAIPPAPPLSASVEQPRQTQPSSPRAAPPPIPAPLPPATSFPPPSPPIPLPPAAQPSGTMSPALVLDLSVGTAAEPTSQSAQAGTIAAPASDEQAVRASIIRNRSSLVPQGTLLAAVLETPIDSTRAGLVRAVVSQDIRGFDGTQVVIPRGSRLIGEAKGDVQAGQRRVLVTWTRLIRPDGVAIRIESPGADRLGGSGVAGRVNSHFAERFANAVLQSALTIGVNIAARPRNGSVIVGVPNQIGTTVAQTPIFNVPAGPTIKVSQGAQIAIFVARDLDFGSAVPRP